MIAAISGAQQPNSPTSSMVVNGVGGPSYPTSVPAPTNSTLTYVFGGLPGSPFMLFFSPTNAVQPGSASYFGDLWDLPTPPGPATYYANHRLFDGFSGNANFTISAQGTRDIHLFVPPPGPAPGFTGIPVGYSASYQAAMADATSPFGAALTAAATITITQGPNRVPLALADTGSINVSLTGSGFTVPFYGTNYSSFFVNADGHITFGAAIVDFSSSPAQLFNGPPRIAGFWCDLDSPAGPPGTPPTHSYEITAPAGGAPGSVRVEFSGVIDWSGSGFVHSFAMLMDANGFVSLQHPFYNQPSIFEVLVGVGRGNLATGPGAAASAAMKNLSSLDGSATSFLDYEAIWEWFGQTTMPSYSLGINNPYDLQGRTLMFQPAGAVGNPTTRYLIL